jgi:hypothetical protein
MIYHMPKLNTRNAPELGANAISAQVYFDPGMMS